MSWVLRMMARENQHCCSQSLFRINTLKWARWRHLQFPSLGSQSFSFRTSFPEAALMRIFEYMSLIRSNSWDKLSLFHIPAHYKIFEHNLTLLYFLNILSFKLDGASFPPLDKACLQKSKWCCLRLVACLSFSFGIIPKSTAIKNDSIVPLEY